MISLPENFKIVAATAGPVTTNGGVTCDYVSLKNVLRAWILLSFTQAVGHATVIQPKRATAVAPTGAVDIATAVPIWQNADTGATDTLVKATSATALTLTDDVKKKMALIQIEVDQLGAGYDVLGCTISDSSQAGNFVSGVYILEERYQQATPPAAITD